MRKKLLISVALMTALFCNAEIIPTSTQLWWGYISESDLPIPSNGSLGYGSACTIDAAIRVPANDAFVGSSTIMAVRLWIGDDMSMISGDVKLWIARTRPTDIAAADYVQTVPLSSLTPGINDIELATPFAAGNSELYIGYTFTLRSRAYPVVCGGTDKPDAFYYRVSGDPEWMDFYGYGYGCLGIQLLLDGGTYPQNRATVDDFVQYISMNDEIVAIPISVTNGGQNPISSLSYTVTTDGNTSMEETINVNPIPYSGSKTVFFLFEGVPEARKYAETLTITKVNGVENTADNRTSTGTLIKLTEKLPVIPVVEEFTGTWCGWCPNGMIGMQEAHELYGDSVVLIAAHSGDVMEISDYSPILAMADGYPSAILNREEDFYPRYTVSFTELGKRKTVLGAISVEAEWSSDAKSAININTVTTFAYNEDNGQYGIAYVLIEDGMTGSGSGWAQSNYLSGRSGYEDETFWYNAPSQVTGLEYDHVAVAAWSIKNGVSGSVKPVFAADEPQYYSFRADISGKSLIQDKSKLKVAVLLIDNSTGAIVNGAQTAIRDFQTGVMKTEDAQAVRYYSIDGRGWTTPQKGLNIMRMSDGTVKKVIVR